MEPMIEVRSCPADVAGPPIRTFRTPASPFYPEQRQVLRAEISSTVYLTCRPWRCEDTDLDVAEEDIRTSCVSE